MRITGLGAASQIVDGLVVVALLIVPGCQFQMP